MSNEDVKNHPRVPGAVIAVICGGGGKNIEIRGTVGHLNSLGEPKQTKPTTPPDQQDQAK